jgi:hypothetical protein
VRPLAPRLPMGIPATAVGCTVRMPADVLIASSSRGILHFVQDDKGVVRAGSRVKAKRKWCLRVNASEGRRNLSIESCLLNVFGNRWIHESSQRSTRSRRPPDRSCRYPLMQVFQ